MACRWLTLKAGLAPGEAVTILDRETREGGALTLYPPWPDRAHVKFVYRKACDRFLVEAVNPTEITLKGPLGGVVRKQRFVFNHDQLAALIAKLTKPKQEPKPRGPREHHLKKSLLAEYDRCLREDEETVTAEYLLAHAKQLEKRKKKKRVPGLSTIGTWLRDHKSQRS
jgi:hypothetical protein